MISLVLQRLLLLIQNSSSFGLHDLVSNNDTSVDSDHRCETMSEKLEEKSKAVVARNLVLEKHTGEKWYELRILCDILELTFQLGKLRFDQTI